jgi:hypothetical protein
MDKSLLEKIGSMPYINIVGVSTVGKSTYSQIISEGLNQNGISNLIVPTDMIKDGLREMILTGFDLPDSISYARRECLLHPSKRLNPEDAIDAAYIVGALKREVNFFLQKKFSGTILYEGFFIPERDSYSLFIQRSFDWMLKVNASRQLARHNNIDRVSLLEESENLFLLQQLFADTLKVEGLNNVSEGLNPVYQNIPLTELLFTNANIINFENFAPEFLRYLGFKNFKNKAVESFLKGVQHAYVRTTDLK